MVLGFTAAICYTISNMCLRDAGRRLDLPWAFWLTAHKALPATCVAWTLVLLRAAKGLPAWPPARVIPRLLMTAVIMQVGGNFLFQIALSRGGLALTVPLVFASIILTGALLGRFVLSEPVQGRTLISMGLVISAVVLLNFGAEAATLSVLGSSSPGTVFLACLAACASGFSYGFGGVMIRRTLREGVPVPATLIIISTTGLIGMGLAGGFGLGYEVIRSVPLKTELTMLGSGIFNAIAFFSIGGALQRLPVVRVNLINASQAAMAAAAGVLVFQEPPTVTLIFGTALTALGLIVLGTEPKKKSLPEVAQDRA